MNTHIDKISSFHSFIGKNNSGKTSVYDLLSYLKDFKISEDRITGSTSFPINAQQLSSTKNPTITVQVDFSERDYDSYCKTYDVLKSSGYFKSATMDFEFHKQDINENADSVTLRIRLNRIQIKNDNDEIDLFVREGDKIKLIMIQKEQSGAGHRGLNGDPQYAPDNTAGFHYFLVSEFLNRTTIVKSVRSSLKRVPVKHVTERNIRGGNYTGDSLANLIHVFHSNDEDKFDEIVDYCYRIFPDIESLTSSILTDNNIAILMRKKGNSQKIELEYSGSGLDQLLILIWTIATGERDTIWLIDEPELHLHPEAENYLYNFFRDRVSEQKQIIVATHSMIFVHKNDLNQISVFQNEGNYSTVVNLSSIIQDNNSEAINSDFDLFKRKIYSALGYDPSFGFESHRILMVEGYVDYKLIPILSERCNKKIDPKECEIIPIGDRERLINNSSIIASLFPNKKVMMIIDNDNKDRDSTLQSILDKKAERIKTLRIKDNLPKENIIFYPENIYSIESFLLEPQAISAVIKQPEKLEEVKNYIESSLDESVKPKDILQSIWNKFQMGAYRELEDGKSIAYEISCQYLDNLEFNLIVDKILIDS